MQANTREKILQHNVQLVMGRKISLDIADKQIKKLGGIRLVYAG